MRWACSLFCALLCLSSLGALFNRSDVVRAETFWLQERNYIQLNLFVSDGYGVQKGSLHEIRLYSLEEAHQEMKPIKEKIKHYGRLVQIEKSLSGSTAIKNKKYFSSLSPIIFKKIKSVHQDYVVQGKLFYCSFNDAFCSIYKFETIIPRKP